MDRVNTQVSMRASAVLEEGCWVGLETGPWGHTAESPPASRLNDAEIGHDRAGDLELWPDHRARRGDDSGSVFLGEVPQLTRAFCTAR